MLILSGFWTYEASKPVYENKEEVVPSYTHHGSYSYTVPVTKENPLYPIGTRLDMGKLAYFFVASPTIDMSFTYNLEAANSADISGKLETMIVATGKQGSATDGSVTDGSATDGSVKEEKIFWQKAFPLKSDDGVDTWNGPSVTKKFSLNVPEVQSMVKSVQDQLNYSQDATIEIVNRVKYTGKINGESVQGTKDFAIPLVISSSYYQMPEKLEFSQDNNITKKVSVESTPSLSNIRIPLALFLLSLVLVGITFICIKMGKVEPAYLEELEKEHKRSPFKEFVSRGKLPKDSNSLMKVEISSLQELVDAASDMNSRVIYDAEAGKYFMINNGAMYVFFDTLEDENTRE